MLIYFAGPLFSEAERCFNVGLTQRLEDLGFDVFLPQRDGVERDRAPYDAMTPEERRRTMFRFDRSRILDSEVFLFVLDGRVPDEGRAWSDARAAFLGARLNPMVRVPLDYIIDDEQTLLQVLAEYETGVQGRTP